MTFTRDGLKLISCNDRSIIKVWELAAGKEKEVHQLSGYSGGINCLAVSPDRLTIPCGGSDGNVKLWQLSTGREIRTFYG